MNESEKTCFECGEKLKPSQFALLKREGQSAIKDAKHLVCRNYPKCSRAEVER